ncbi:IS701-like element ISBj9 family transposase [Craurococcus roseus]|uniref:IS701-like element ISBj9 family transposase n=1 Tax=Craurococcus roseus TaxID=77585 RepID=A0ABN1GAC0_9PROT
MAVHGKGWLSELKAWSEPFLVALEHPARRHWAPYYLRGLLLPGERKSVQPMSMRLGLAAHDQLHNFVASPSWDGAPLEAVLAAKADALVGGADSVLVVDDTALPKKGSASVGVAHQYAGALGKNANCQTLVSLTPARHEVPVPVALRLFLPRDWVADPARLERAGVPQAHRAPRAKGEVALGEIDRLVALGLRFGCVLADAGYGNSALFRQALSARGLHWAVGIPKVQAAYGTEVALLRPKAARGRPRLKPVPSERPVPAEALLAGAEWRPIAWRRGTKAPLAAEFAALRVRVADGEAVRGGIHLPGEEAWLVGERRASGEVKYHLSNLPAGTSVERLAGLIKARWVCEQAHQQMKEELGLDHFEGRSWHGLHHHALMVMVALAFLQHLRLAEHRRRTGPGKNAAPRSGPAAVAEPARRARGARRVAAQAAGPPHAVPALPP